MFTLKEAISISHNGWRENMALFQTLVLEYWDCIEQKIVPKALFYKKSK